MQKIDMKMQDVELVGALAHELLGEAVELGVMHEEPLDLEVFVEVGAFRQVSQMSPRCDI